MEVASPNLASRGVSLDSAPPRPPGGKNAFMPTPPEPEGGLGELANSPTLLTMQGLAMAKDAFQLIANGVPALAQMLSASIADLEQMVAQAITQTQSGTQPQIAAPPGVAPMMSPPPGGGAGPMPGAPPGGMPGGMPQGA